MKLSKAQNEVVDLLKSGLFIWTNEGKNYSAWIGDNEGTKIKTLNIKTVSFLYNNKIIKFEDGNYKKDLFKYILNK